MQKAFPQSASQFGQEGIMVAVALGQQQQEAIAREHEANGEDVTKLEKEMQDAAAASLARNGPRRRRFARRWVRRTERTCRCE